MDNTAQTYDGLIGIGQQATVCIEQLQYLEQMVSGLGMPTDNTDGAIAHLQQAYANVQQYLADNFPNGRPDDSGVTAEQATN